MTTPPQPQPPPESPANGEGRVRIVQMLCGPRRHAIIALPYFPGTSAQGFDDNDIVITEANAIEFVQTAVDRLIEAKAFDPWCGLCFSPSQDWFLEDGVTRFKTMEEAMPHLAASAAEQVKARLFYSDIHKRSN